ncbi:hypothetical protein FDP41_012416 [Naegleria fowleri]|uniref:Uncharacterized protein n=1 Tax=Naegleria fowleri TaxID=5763 RepID=A0A6A5C902_NAEFO|nr:uncharacterized protein FDP41_012416 [Naegleria fowleri]KAF0981759.1 hypothetical protein FDP41_012416 [Naegleria fowleri]
MTFSFPQSREDFMSLVQQVAKEDVKRCLAGIPVTHPHLAKLMMAPHDSNCFGRTSAKEEEEQFFNAFRNQQQHNNNNSTTHIQQESSSSVEVPLISSTKSNNNNVQHSEPQLPDRNQPKPSNTTNDTSQISNKQRTPEKPSPKTNARKKLSEKTNIINQQQNSKKNEQPASPSPKKTSPKHTSPNNADRNVYERLLKPTVSTQKKFEKETKPQKKEEKEFRELRKEQKKATSLLLRKTPSTKKQSPKTSPKNNKNVSFSVALGQVQYKDYCEEDKENINDMNETYQEDIEKNLNNLDHVNSSPPSTPSPPNQTQQQIVVRTSPQTPSPKASEAENPPTVAQTNNGVGDKLSPKNDRSQPNPTIEILNPEVEVCHTLQKDSSLIPSNTSTSSTSSNKAAPQKSTINYEQLEDMVMNDLLLELAKEQHKRKEIKHQQFKTLQAKNKQNQQFDEMLNLLREMEQKENLIRKRYQNQNNLELSDDTSYLSSSLDSSSSLSTTDVTLRKQVVLDEHTKSKIRKARQKQKRYFETLCRPHEVSVETLMQVIGEDIINEVFSEVCHEFSDAMSDIVKTVSANEFGCVNTSTFTSSSSGLASLGQNESGLSFT